MTSKSLDPRLSRLRLRHLEFLNAVIEHGSLRAAARKLGLAQPASGALLQDLEHAFGTKLFERTASGAIPLATAKLLSARASIAIEDLKIAADELQRTRAPILRTGIVPNVIALHGGQWLAQLRNALPELCVRIMVSGAQDLIKGVTTGQLDLAIARISPAHVVSSIHESCEVKPMMTDPLCIVARTAHPLARAQRTFSAQDLSSQKWVLPQSQSQTYRILCKAYAQNGLTVPPAAIEVDGMAYCLAMAAESDLLTLCSLSMVREGLLAGRFRVLKTSLNIDAPVLSLLYRRESSRLPAIETLIEILLDKRNHPANTP